MIKVFYTREMSVPSGGYSPSADKPRQVVADWVSRGLRIEIVAPRPIARGELKLAHSARYINRIFNARIPNGHGNYSRVVADSTLYTVGSLIEASLESLKSGVACSPTSGFHHASYEENHGFCTFNGLVIAARKLIEHGVKNVLILDFDFHYGDGTADILDQLRHEIGGSIASISGCGREILDKHWIRDQLEVYRPGAIIYQAGADQHINDPLGGLFNDDELRLRDREVFTVCKQLGIPVTWCLAGGYQRDSVGGIEPVLEIHRATMEECIRHYSLV